MEKPTNTTEKPTKGAWDNVQGYPMRIKFVEDKAVTVTFAQDFDVPKEMPSTNNTPDNDNNEVYYIFDCIAEGTRSSISTSAWTLLNSLKTHMPLAGKTLIITLKIVNGKKMYYVTTPDNAEKVADFDKTESEKVSEAAAEKLAELHNDTTEM